MKALRWLLAVLIASSLAVACGEPDDDFARRQPVEAEVEDCDFDDVLEGDDDCYGD